MLHMKTRMVKVLVTNAQKDRLDKWALETCYGEKVRETLVLRTKQTEVVYRFLEDRWREHFIDGLKINFGSAVELL